MSGQKKRVQSKGVQEQKSCFHITDGDVPCDLNSIHLFRFHSGRAAMKFQHTTAHVPFSLNSSNVYRDKSWHNSFCAVNRVQG